MSEQMTLPAALPAEGLAWQVAVATLSRLFINTARRFAYPFAPALSRGLDVPLTAITWIIAANQATGLLSPLFGPLGDRWGYRVMLLLGLSIIAVGLLSGGLIGVYGAVLVALFLVGLGKAMFDPAIQAYVGERVPYRRRGLVIGVIEFSWAGSFLIGIPFVGLLIDRLGWRAPFFALGGLCLLGIAAIGLLIPSDRHRRHIAQPSPGFRAAWDLVSRDRAALGALGFAFLLNIGSDSLFVNYGVWLEDAFALGVVAVGTASTTIGIAELVGEGFTAFAADRVGLKRAVIIGLSLAALSYISLPFIGQTLPLALAGLFVLFLTFEFTVVTAYSLFTEVLPRARGTMMAALTAASGLGRVFGALIGGAVWQTGGLLAVCLVAGALSLLALACFGWGLRHWRD